MFLDLVGYISKKFQKLSKGVFKIFQRFTKIFKTNYRKSFKISDNFFYNFSKVVFFYVIKIRYRNINQDGPYQTQSNSIATQDKPLAPFASKKKLLIFELWLFIDILVWKLVKTFFSICIVVKEPFNLLCLICRSPNQKCRSNISFQKLRDTGLLL